ncbi:TetR/AcrR family transcriptional regulator [Streptomyces mexicanus]|uniref:TetR/AcrR family transcriptional regulator n=1 Tax=Streptomyces mexicanus TaxID=178566 RepID=A0A7X1I234_9ACTN|nr:TetR/AcrR family transcriptional regulator [Streptomyces mexicanus]MBC2867066.1 TetR/AcrR family transcriptional regulator [Streptomyces mexicanus]
MRMVKQERARRTREKVLDAAAEEFAVRGYDKATLDAVARRTGMTKGALYGHFSSKADLAAALLVRCQEVWRELVPAGGEQGVTARTALESLAAGLFRRLREDVRLRAALRLSSDCPNLARSAPDVLRDVHRVLEDLVRRAQREGDMPPHPPELVARLLLAVMYGALHLPPGPGGCGRTSIWPAEWRLLLDALSGEPAWPHASAVRDHPVSGP